MGCDIHIVVERKEPDSEWVGVWADDQLPFPRHVANRRDYGFFGEVARVRHETPTGVWPRNLPKDISRLAWLMYMRCPTDYHSASHMTCAEFAQAWRRANPYDAQNEWTNKIQVGHEIRGLLGVYTDEGDGVEYRVVFWFDN